MLDAWFGYRLQAEHLCGAVATCAVSSPAATRPATPPQARPPLPPSNTTQHNLLSSNLNSCTHPHARTQQAAGEKTFGAFSGKNCVQLASAQCANNPCAAKGVRCAKGLACRAVACDGKLHACSTKCVADVKDEPAPAAAADAASAAADGAAALTPEQLQEQLDAAVAAAKPEAGKPQEEGKPQQEGAAVEEVEEREVDQEDIFVPSTEHEAPPPEGAPGVGEGHLTLGAPLPEGHELFEDGAPLPVGHELPASAVVSTGDPEAAFGADPALEDALSTVRPEDLARAVTQLQDALSQEADAALKNAAALADAIRESAAAVAEAAAHPEESNFGRTEKGLQRLPIAWTVSARADGACPAGYALDGKLCRRCPQGHVRAEGEAACKICAPGTWADVAQQQCM